MKDWNPVSVEQALWELKENIAKGVNIVDRALAKLDEADEEFIIAEANAYLAADEYPAHERKYRTVLATVEQRAKRRVAERAYKKAINTMYSLKDGLEAVRSIGAGVREAYNVAGVGER